MCLTEAGRKLSDMIWRSWERRFLDCPPEFIHFNWQNLISLQLLCLLTENFFLKWKYYWKEWPTKLLTEASGWASISMETASPVHQFPLHPSPHMHWRCSKLPDLSQSWLSSAGAERFEDRFFLRITHALQESLQFWIPDCSENPLQLKMDASF
jgi:hypothetical protein